MSGNRGPNLSSLGPISGFDPCKLMWSLITTSASLRIVALNAAGGVGQDYRLHAEASRTRASGSYVLRRSSLRSRCTRPCMASNGQHFPTLPITNLPGMAYVPWVAENGRFWRRRCVQRPPSGRRKRQVRSRERARLRPQFRFLRANEFARPASAFAYSSGCLMTSTAVFISSKGFQRSTRTSG